MGFLDFFKRRQKKKEKPKSGISMHQIESYYSPEKRRYVRPVYSKSKGTIYERELTDEYFERLGKFQELSNQWYSEAESVVAEILDKDREGFDGFKFYTLDKASKTKLANKLSLRPNGNFDIETTSTEYGEQWPGYKLDKNGKGYTPKEVAEEIFATLYNDVSRASKKARSELIGLVKNVVKIDLRREIKERKKKGGLEGKVLPTITSLAFLGSIFFLSPKITGNVIAELPIKTTSLIGLLMLGVCFIGLLRIKNRI